jgi:hypothetical protein
LEVAGRQSVEGFLCMDVDVLQRLLLTYDGWEMETVDGMETNFSGENKHISKGRPQRGAEY